MINDAGDGVNLEIPVVVTFRVTVGSVDCSINDFVDEFKLLLVLVPGTLPLPLPLPILLLLVKFAGAAEVVVVGVVVKVEE